MLLISSFDSGQKQTEKKLIGDFADRNYCAENLLNDNFVVFYKQLGNNRKLQVIQVQVVLSSFKRIHLQEIVLGQPYVNA